MTDSKPTPLDDDQPFLIHGLRPEGVVYVAYAPPGNPYGARPGRLAFGEELLVTKEIRDANRNRNGISWLEYTEAEQEVEYGPGKHRFGYGPTPPSVVAQVRAARRAELEAQRANLLKNSHAAGRFAAEKSFLSSLDAELLALDAEAQNS